MCDDNSILLGVNKYNSSLIIVDIFNSAVYKYAIMVIPGTSGAEIYFHIFKKEHK